MTKKNETGIQASKKASSPRHFSARKSGNKRQSAKAAAHSPSHIADVLAESEQINSDIMAEYNDMHQGIVDTSGTPPVTPVAVAPEDPASPSQEGSAKDNPPTKPGQSMPTSTFPLRPTTDGRAPLGTPSRSRRTEVDLLSDIGKENTRPPLHQARGDTLSPRAVRLQKRAARKREAEASISNRLRFEQGLAGQAMDPLMAAENRRRLERELDAGKNEYIKVTGNDSPPGN